MATRLKVAPCDGTTLVVDCGCCVMLIADDMGAPLTANTPELSVEPPPGLVNVMEAMGRLEPRAARLIVV